VIVEEGTASAASQRTAVFKGRLKLSECFPVFRKVVEEIFFSTLDNRKKEGLLVVSIMTVTNTF